jgi:hypothetical protein
MFVNFFSENRTVYNAEKHGRAGQATDDNIIRRMHIAYWITKGTDTEYVILTVFPRQQCLRERASLVCYTALPVLLILAMNCI